MRGPVRSGFNCPPTRLAAPPHALFILLCYTYHLAQSLLATCIKSTFGRDCVLFSHRHPVPMASDPASLISVGSLRSVSSLGGVPCETLQANHYKAPFSMKLQAQRGNPLFNVCRSSLLLPSPTGCRDTALSSVIFPTISRPCWLHVSFLTLFGVVRLITLQPDISEANHFVTEGGLRKGCIVRLKSFQANAVKGKKYALLP